ncbi:MAG: hypothetical protein VKN72_28265 [Nostocales cyanobacterium 94392]|nr:hypothetical protein [Nostocales cyanobacterium 94392]
MIAEHYRIIQLTNDKRQEVFNGDIGFVKAIGGEEQEVVIQYDGRELT